MATSSKSNWLVVAVIALAAVNLVTLGFLWFGGRRGGQPPRRDARQFLVSELQLSPAQTAQFDSLRKIHFTTVDSLRDEVRRLKDQLFAQLTWPENSAYLDISQHIGTAQTRIERATFEHFHALRAICTPQQQAKFDRIIQEVLRTMGPPVGMPPGGGSPGEGPPPSQPPPPRP